MGDNIIDNLVNNKLIILLVVVVIIIVIIIVLVNAGTKDSEEDDGDKKVAIPKDIKAKDSVDLKKIDPKQHFTQPPPKYTEGSLVKELEKEAGA